MARILVIDDDVMVRDVVAQVLMRSGHTVVQAANGIDGVARLSAAPVDLVITDLVMPGTAGIEVIGALHRDFPSLKIIAMSGSLVASNYLRIAEFMGARHTLQKPFSAEELVSIVNEALGRDHTPLLEPI
jgi:DNA-binding NtrC family response regulator